MSGSDKSEKQLFHQLIDKIEFLESRISRIEGLMHSGAYQQSKSDQELPEERYTEAEENTSISIESRLGDSGLAWIGSFILFSAIIFLMNYVRSTNHQLVAAFIGYAGTATVFAIAYFMRNSSQNIIKTLKIIGYILLFYVSLLLHFFSNEPVITNLGISLVFILVSISLMFIHAVRRKSEFIASVALLMTVLTSLFANSIFITMTLLIASAIISMYFMYRFSWWRLVFFSMILVYLSHLIMLIGNPIMGHQIEIMTDHQYNLIFLFVYGLVFSLIALIPRSDIFKEQVYISAILLNGMSFSFVLLTVIYLFFQENFLVVFEVITIMCLLFSIYLHQKAYSLFVPSIYAVYGFMALSVVVYGFTNLPLVFLFLCLQSLLVLSLALWYRSKTIVIVNVLLYIMILITYLVLPSMSNSINFTFAAVALISARIINWQKKRLILTSEVLRNVYLIIAFVMVLVFLYFALPHKYVIFASTAMAAIYFVLSILIDNVKYRYMAISTILITIVYLFLIDPDQITFGLRIFSFVALAILTLVVSVYYARKKRPVQESQDK